MMKMEDLMHLLPISEQSFPVEDQGSTPLSWLYVLEHILAANTFGERVSKQMLLDCVYDCGHEGLIQTNELNIRNGDKSVETKVDDNGLYSHGTYFGAWIVRNRIGACSEIRYPFFNGIRMDCMCEEIGFRKIPERLVDLGTCSDHEINKLMDFGLLIGASVIATPEFQKHRGDGIFTGISTPSATIGEPQYDHSVVIVSRGQENGIEYYWIRNSWGSEWGCHGYAKVKKNLLGRLFTVIGVEDFEANDLPFKRL